MHDGGPWGALEDSIRKLLKDSHFAWVVGETS